MERLQASASPRIIPASLDIDEVPIETIGTFQVPQIHPVLKWLFNNILKNNLAGSNVESPNENIKQPPLRFLLHLSAQASAVDHWSIAWDTPEELIPVALQAAKDAQLIGSSATAAECRVLAKQHWGGRILIVFDLANDAYDAAVGHLKEHNVFNVLTVYYKRHRIIVQEATEGVRLKVNEDVRQQHDMHGWGSTPVFEEDHRDGKYPTYNNPRSLVYSNLRDHASAHPND